MGYYETNNEYNFDGLDFSEYDAYEEGSKQEGIHREKGAAVEDIALTYIEDAVIMGDAGPTLYRLIHAVVDYTLEHKGWLPAPALVEVANELKRIGLEHVDK